jgi:hypothetical protein
MRDTTPNHVPHLAYDEDGACWYVRAKTAPGEYLILSNATASKRLAGRDLRRIRREMLKLWDRAPLREAVRSGREG